MLMFLRASQTGLNSEKAKSLAGTGNFTKVISNDVKFNLNNIHFLILGNVHQSAVSKWFH